MLTTLICDTEHSPWPFRKYSASSRRPESPRMSDRYDLPLPVQPDWQGQYSYLPQHDSDIFSRSFGDSRNAPEDPRRPHLTGEGAPPGPDPHVKKEQGSPEGLRCAADSLGPRSVRHPSPGEDQSIIADTAAGFGRGDSSASADPFPRSSGPNHFRTVLSTDETSGPGPTRYERDVKDFVTGEEADFEGDDDEAIGGEGESAGRPQTMAERLAARRKMKRFRLTHQQTRFLMSEFAKQPHPDAAHRERLSREIPGLSPRQVQVWFQNRRAKIKRLTADDRDRMIRMRAVPDDFDNVQALHSPYGAVHGIGGTLSPGDAANPSYGNHMLRPLMVDVRRQEDAYMSPTALTPSFGGIDLGQPGGMGGSDMVPPLSSVSNDRYAAGGLLSAPSRTSNPHLGRPGPRQGAPMHMRESIPRSTSDSLQSPLRANMSWKSDSFDYSMYQGGNSTSSAADRRQSNYQAGQMGSAAGSALGGFDSSSYSGSHNHPASSGLSYSNLQQSSQNRSRARSSSASLPLSIDFGFRDTYRPPVSGPPTGSPPYPSRPPATTPATKQDGSSVYSASYPSAPLSAPLNLSPRRTFSGRVGVNEYSAPQMSAPITAPNDFEREFHASVTSQPSSSAMKDYFGSGSMGYSQG
ncbi:Homeobox-leucine zipper protein HDG11 [Tolypocladium capitatum]|uniref:Homeobox-leucine zipper protein HDG11 n=1 Tax=Tolypocladium capitatum TaxID=45235 RepID=A0A2K3QIM7_9HYPO|nr:Homeobox-leucine zipper protein HDG11 [Tolypocladium capitatum]